MRSTRNVVNANPGDQAGQYSDPPLLVLASLASGPKHGHAMIDDITSLCGKHLGPGTLYGAIARLEQQGWIEPLPADERREPYRITPAGVSVLRARLTTLQQFSTAALRRLEAHCITSSLTCWCAFTRLPGEADMAQSSRLFLKPARAVCWLQRMLAGRPYVNASLQRNKEATIKVPAVFSRDPGSFERRGRCWAWALCSFFQWLTRSLCSCCGWDGGCFCQEPIAHSSGRSTGSKTSISKLQGVYISRHLCLLAGRCGLWPHARMPERIWLSVGLILIALVSATNQIHASRSEVSRGLGHISLTFGAGTSFQMFRDRLIYATAVLAIAMLPYLTWRVQKARSRFV